MAQLVRALLRLFPARFRYLDQRALVRLRYYIQGISWLAGAASRRAGPPHRHRQCVASVRGAHTELRSVTMSFFPGKDPDAGDSHQCDAIAQVIVPRTVDLGDFAVRRALPSAQTRMVGPFIFFDHFGPAEFHAGNGLDVRPHPHIGLATVTYLFDGEIMHRDSLGTEMAIRPGEINWMTAGRGIVHSERTRPERRIDGEPIHGLQMWVALPAAREEMEAGFAHHATAEFPVVKENGKNVRVVVGSLYGASSPVLTVHETIFGDVHLKAGTSLPLDAGHEERAIYIIEGVVDIAGDK